MENYLKENNLDPAKDWSKDKTHGKAVKELMAKLNKERDKVAAQYPEKDTANQKKLVKMKKASEDEKKAKKEAKVKEKKEKLVQVEQQLNTIILGRRKRNDFRRKEEISYGSEKIGCR